MTGWTSTKLWPFLSLFSLASLLGACNSVFFQPDDEVYSRADEFDPHAREAWISSAGGHRLHAWVLPSAPGVARRGVVLHFHGNAQNLTSHVFFVSWLTREGFDVVAFDYRGYGRSAGSPSREAAIEDGVSALEFAWKHAQGREAGVAGGAGVAGVAESALPVPLFVVAQSLGGALGTVAVERFEDLSAGRVRGLALDSTFGSWRGLARLKLGQSVLTWPLQWPLSFLVSDASDASSALARLRMPVFLTHATDDIVVPFEAGLALARAMPVLPSSRFVAAKGGHTAAFAPGEGNLRAALVNFFREAERSVILAPGVR